LYSRHTTKGTSIGLKGYFDGFDVRHSIVSMNSSESKQAYIDRFKRTLLGKLPREYIDRLDEIVDEYNNTRHTKFE
jgi:hypothetical protein